MADGTRPAIGLSVGATNLAAVTEARAVTRRAVLTMYRHRPSEVGVPSENPNLDEPGLVIADFVERVGDPVGIVAADGSTHRGEVLVADALRALAYAATDGCRLPEAVVLAYPAHWGPTAVDALQTALDRSECFGGRQPLTLLTDAAASLIALQANPGVPTRGVIAVCDFGGTGTNIALVDAANDYRPVTATVRHADFSGDLIDQALLSHILGELSVAGSLDASGTSAIGSLTRLRAECRRAKEELSSRTATTLTAELPGFRGDVRLTRAELDGAIRQPLDTFLTVLQQTIERSGIRSADLAAVASIGGGASVPAIATTLSERLRVPLIAAPRPHLTAAIGAALRGARGAADDKKTTLTPAASAVLPVGDATPSGTEAGVEAVPSARHALAWSEADNDSQMMPVSPGADPGRHREGLTSARPQLTFDDDASPKDTGRAASAWYLRPPVLVLGTAVIVLAVGAAAVIALRHMSGGAPASPAPSVSPLGPITSASPTQSAAPATQTVPGGPPPVAGQPSSSTGPTATPPPSATQSVATQPPSAPESTTTPVPSSTQTTATPMPSSTQPATQPPSSTQPQPPPTTQNPPTSAQPPFIPPIPTIPPIPAIPAIPGIPQSLPQPGTGG